MKKQSSKRGKVTSQEYLAIGKSLPENYIMLRSRELSQYKDFSSRVTEVLGVYLSRTTRVLALCVTGETTTWNPPPKEIHPFHESDYKSARFHNETNYGISALIKQLGQLDNAPLKERLSEYSAKELRIFLEKLDKAFPKNAVLLLVADDGKTIQTPGINAWIKSHPRFEPLVTSTNKWCDTVAQLLKTLACQPILSPIFVNMNDLMDDLDINLFRDKEEPSNKSFVWTSDKKAILRQLKYIGTEKYIGLPTAKAYQIFHAYLEEHALPQTKLRFTDYITFCYACLDPSRHDARWEVKSHWDKIKHAVILAHLLPDELEQYLRTLDHDKSPKDNWVLITARKMAKNPAFTFGLFEICRSYLQNRSDQDKITDACRQCPDLLFGAFDKSNITITDIAIIEKLSGVSKVDGKQIRRAKEALIQEERIYSKFQFEATCRHVHESMPIFSQTIREVEPDQTKSAVD